MKLIAAAAALLLLPAGHLLANPIPQYQVVPLHSLRGTETEETADYQPHALNSKGESVGTATSHSKLHAVWWDVRGAIHLLGKPSDHLSIAEGINDTNQIIAFADTPTIRLFLIDRRGKHLLKPPVGTQIFEFFGGAALSIAGQAAFINNTGQAAFNVETEAGFPFCAVVSTHGVTKDLGHLTLRSNVPQIEAFMVHTHVHALNNSGMAAGGSEAYVKGVETVPARAFFWHKGVMTDLGTLPGYDDSTATALNNRGDVIGTMSSAAESQAGPSPDLNVHGFLWRNGVMTNLGALPCCRYTEPTGINDKGQIVGNSYNFIKEGEDYTQSGGADGGEVFLWQGGKMTDLQTLVPSGWRLQSAVAINNRGDILCTGYHDGMPSRTLGSGAFVLRRTGVPFASK